MKKNPVVHFEMPYENHERLSKFYSSAFGWEMHKMGPEMGDYVLAGTTETDENQMVKTPGTINGGFFAKSPDVPPYPSVVISVDDVNESMKKIKDAGGKIIGEPQEIPGIGHWVVFTDSEGNRVSIIQSAKS
jgi:predicted enzyme related to lactoylglutathione lyase